MSGITSRRWMKPLVPFFLLLSGCVALETNVLNPAAPPAPGLPAQIVASWRPDVYFTADPVHAGAETPTLAGRVYLFGPEIKFPMTGDGSLVVDLYEGAIQPGANVAPLEEWRFNPNEFRTLLKRDAIGWGYTVLLPWGTYRPDLTQVQLKVRYEPPKGFPLFAPSSAMALNNPNAAAAPAITTAAKPPGS
jgi:hypothetical protein